MASSGHSSGADLPHNPPAPETASNVPRQTLRSPPTLILPPFSLEPPPHSTAELLYGPPQLAPSPTDAQSGHVRPPQPQPATTELPSEPQVPRLQLLPRNALIARAYERGFNRVYNVRPSPQQTMNFPHNSNSERQLAGMGLTGLTPEVMATRPQMATWTTSPLRPTAPPFYLPRATTRSPRNDFRTPAIAAQNQPTTAPVGRRIDPEMLRVMTQALSTPPIYPRNPDRSLMTAEEQREFRERAQQYVETVARPLAPDRGEIEVTNRAQNRPIPPTVNQRFEQEARRLENNILFRQVRESAPHRVWGARSALDQAIPVVAQSRWEPQEAAARRFALEEYTRARSGPAVQQQVPSQKAVVLQPTAEQTAFMHGAVQLAALQADFNAAAQPLVEGRNNRPTRWAPVQPLIPQQPHETEEDLFRSNGIQRPNVPGTATPIPQQRPIQRDWAPLNDGAVDADGFRSPLDRLVDTTPRRPPGTQVANDPDIGAQSPGSAAASVASNYEACIRILQELEDRGIGLDEYERDLRDRMEIHLPPGDDMGDYPVLRLRDGMLDVMERMRTAARILEKRRKRRREKMEAELDAVGEGQKNENTWRRERDDVLMRYREMEDCERRAREGKRLSGVSKTCRVHLGMSTCGNG